MDYCGFTDDQLVAFAQKGTADAFGELTNRYLSRIFTTAFRIIKDRQEAEDAAQEIFTLAWAKIRLFGFRSKFSTWLYRIAHNYCIDISRSKKRQPTQGILPPEDEAKNDTIKTPVDELQIKEGEKAVKKILRRLSKRQRQIVKLRQKDKTIKEITIELGYSLATVKRDLVEIKTILGKLIKEDKDVQKN